ncbi:MAG TPA: multidrug effflux MFS transporter [Steroidobacteraceae bacterium]
MTQPTHVRDRPLILLLAACGAIGGIATNLFLPALPEIRGNFSASIAASQTTISAYVSAFAVGILIVGPLSDRFGRRPVMIGGIAIFTLGSFVCAWAPTLAWLVAGRVVQAIGASAGITVARATIGDLYTGVEVASRMAVLTMVMVAGPAISPFLGGFIAAAFGWRMDFWIMLVAGVALLIACWALLPETRGRHHAPLGFADLWRVSGRLLSNRVFVVYSIQAGVIFSMFLVFMSVAPYIMSGPLRRPPTEFGMYSLSLSSGYFLGNLYVSRHAHRTNADRLVSLGLWLQLGASAVCLMIAMIGIPHPVWLFGPMVPLTFAQGLALPYITGRAVSLAPGHSGVASSLVGFSQQALAAISVQMMGWAAHDSAVPLFTFYTSAAVVCILPVLMFARRSSPA